MITNRAPTTALPALASLNSVITNRAPTRALPALASQNAVLAVVELNPNALGVHARRCFPHTPNVIFLLPPRAAVILMEALEAHALRIAVPALHLLSSLSFQT